MARLVDKKLLAQIRTQPCCICNARPVDACHIRTRGSGGPDTSWNVMPMCRRHHTEQGHLGWRIFTDRYPKAMHELTVRGWELREEFGVVKLRRVCADL